MARLVRDLARKSGKNVHFVTEGEDTEIDRNMVEVLNDPLVHMIRNAVDHGIEPPRTRRRPARPRPGTVRLRAYHAAGNVVIELVDDGKGLDRERIIRQGDRARLITPGDRPDRQRDLRPDLPAGLLDRRDSHRRVRPRRRHGRRQEERRESCEAESTIASDAGKARTFTMRLPLTMAIIDAMILAWATERYLLPTVSDRAELPPAEAAISTVGGKGEMVELRGHCCRCSACTTCSACRGAVSKPRRTACWWWWRPRGDGWRSWWTNCWASSRWS